MKTTTKKRKTPRTSNRVSSRAGRLLDMCDEGRFTFIPFDMTQPMGERDVSVLVASVAASCLVQRERGPRGRK